MNITMIWLAALALLFGIAAAMEAGAIRNRIDGANGLVIFVAGILGLFSVPMGFALLWWQQDLATAFRITAVVALIAGAGWWGLIRWLDRLARRRASSPQ